MWAVAAIILPCACCCYAGDIIVRVNDRSISRSSDLANVLDDFQQGEQVRLFARHSNCHVLPVACKTCLAVVCPSHAILKQSFEGSKKEPMGILPGKWQ